MMKTALAVSIATSVMAFFDTTHGLVGAGVSAWLMIAPSSEMGKEWARNQFLGALLGAVVGATVGHFIGWAPLLSGPVLVLLMLVTIQLGAKSALNAAVVHCLFILEHTDRSWEYAAFRITAALFGLVVGYLVNRYVLPYTAPKPIPEIAPGD
jgi:uncharacterized membrane protein YgaE (UPF0421/DUF939 family)